MNQSDSLKSSMRAFLLFTSVLLFVSNSVGFSQQSDTTSFGWLSFDASIDTFYVVVDYNYNEAYHVKGDSIKLESGKHSLILIHPEYQDERVRINIKSGGRHLIVTEFSNKIKDDSTLSSYTRLEKGLAYNITIRTDPKSSITIDDSTYGKGFLKTDIGPFEHNISLKHPTARNRSKDIYINPSGKKDLVFYLRPKKSNAILLGAIPSASQWYKNQKIKGAIFSIAFAGATAYTILKNKEYQDLNAEYQNMKLTYNSIIDEEEALNYGNLVEQKFEETKNVATIRDISLATTIGIYAYNLLDAILSKPKSGYQVSLEPIGFQTNRMTNKGLKLKVAF